MFSKQTTFFPTKPLINFRKEIPFIFTIKCTLLNPFFATNLFCYPLKTSGFQGLSKKISGMKRVKKSKYENG